MGAEPRLHLLKQESQCPSPPHKGTLTSAHMPPQHGLTPARDPLRFCDSWNLVC